MYSCSPTCEASRRPSRAVPTPPDLEIAATVLEQIVLRAFAVEADTLRGRRRGRARVAFARQVAIYVLHVRLGLSLTRAARLFGRDRTTAAHACRVVEDRRDAARIDAVVATVEAAVEQWMTARAGAAAAVEVMQ